MVIKFCWKRVKGKFEVWVCSLSDLQLHLKSRGSGWKRALAMFMLWLMY